MSLVRKIHVVAFQVRTQSYWRNSGTRTGTRWAPTQLYTYLYAHEYYTVVKQSRAS